MIDTDIVRQAADGRWPELLNRLGGVPSEILDGKHHPCPLCGGADRFRMIDMQRGAVMCNKCFNEKNGDGFAALGWLTKQDFGAVLRLVASEVGVKPNGDSTPVDVITQVARRKHVTPEVLTAFGAVIADRNGQEVCRVPMLNAEGKSCGFFDMAPTDELDKGKTMKGSKHGLFMVAMPDPRRPVVLVEGVKDAAALHAINIQAVGLPTCRMAATFARVFRDCKVIIVPDRDKAGIDGAATTAANLFGVAAEVKIAELPAAYKETDGADVRDVLRMNDGKTKVLDAIANANPWGRPGQHTVTAIPMYDVVERFIDTLGDQPPLLELGIAEVDYAIGGGVQRGEMVIIAGRPSHGKTVVGMQALDKLAQQTPTLMISEEMAAIALAQRMVAGMTDLDPTTWVSNKDEIIQKAISFFAGRRQMLLAESCGTVEEALRVIEEAKQQHEIGAVTVDYVQLLKGKGNGRYEQVSDVSTRLKQAAIRFDIVMLAVCQLNRATEGRQGGGPRMSDLRDSGQLEQDADVILFVNWPSRNDPKAVKAGTIQNTDYEIHIGKNRNRATKRTTIHCVFKAERQRIYGKEERESYSEQPQTFSEFNDFR